MSSKDQWPITNHWRDVKTWLQSELYSSFEGRELKSLISLIIQSVSQKNQAKLIAFDHHFSEAELVRCKSIKNKLIQGQPIQYILGFATFFGHEFKVTSDVLVPRPETEELVQLVINATKGAERIIDVGTGSGAIAISIAKALPTANITALDVSKEAIAIAKENADQIGVKNVSFLTQDFLSFRTSDQFEVIVSNPPYIPEQEASSMPDDVIKMEPHLALFVPDDEPLKFYTALARFSRYHLKPYGHLMVEIHENLAQDVKACFEQHGLSDVEIYQDLQGKNRMVSARLLQLG